MGRYEVTDVIFGRVYVIKNKIDNMIYIGSTTKTLAKRFADHMWSFHNLPEGVLYKHMKLIGPNQFYIQIINHKVVENETELRMLEQLEIDKYNPNILLNCRDSYSAKNRSYIAKCATKDPNYYEKERQRNKIYRTKNRQPNIEDNSEIEHEATGEF